MKVAHRYGFVRAIALILKVLAWLVLLASIAGAVFGVTLLGRTAAQTLLPTALLGTGTVIASLLAGIFWFVPLYAFGSILSLLLDIEENTRALATYQPSIETTEVPQA